MGPGPPKRHASAMGNVTNMASAIVDLLKDAIHANTTMTLHCGGQAIAMQHHTLLQRYMQMNMNMPPSMHSADMVGMIAMGMHAGAMPQMMLTSHCSQMSSPKRHSTSTYSSTDSSADPSTEATAEVNASGATDARAKATAPGVWKETTESTNKPDPAAEQEKPEPAEHVPVQAASATLNVPAVVPASATATITNYPSTRSVPPPQVPSPRAHRGTKRKHDHATGATSNSRPPTVASSSHSEEQLPWGQEIVHPGASRSSSSAEPPAKGAFALASDQAAQQHWSDKSAQQHRHRRKRRRGESHDESPSSSSRTHAGCWTSSTR